jgi:tRNA(fMet)-specific endonuclease VapC
MDEPLIILDTGVLIDYFRKTKKENSYLYQLSTTHSRFAVSIITKFEILIGSSDRQKDFWTTFFARVEVIDFGDRANEIAVVIHRQLKIKNQMIGFADLLIGATVMASGGELATLNHSHFNRIEGLTILPLP